MSMKKNCSQAPSTGFITLPAEVGEEKMVVELAHKWGADAIRDSDGTELSQEMLDLGLEVYSTTCLVRAEQTYPRRHMDQLPQKFLMSDPVTATVHPAGDRSDERVLPREIRHRHANTTPEEVLGGHRPHHRPDRQALAMDVSIHGPARSPFAAPFRSMFTR